MNENQVFIDKRTSIKKLLDNCRLQRMAIKRCHEAIFNPFDSGTKYKYNTIIENRKNNLKESQKKLLEKRKEKGVRK